MPHNEIPLRDTPRTHSDELPSDFGLDAAIKRHRERRINAFGTSDAAQEADALETHRRNSHREEWARRRRLGT